MSIDVAKWSTDEKDDDFKGQANDDSKQDPSGQEGAPKGDPAGPANNGGQNPEGSEDPFEITDEFWDRDDKNSGDPAGSNNGGNNGSPQPPANGGEGKSEFQRAAEALGLTGEFKSYEDVKRAVDQRSQANSSNADLQKYLSDEEKGLLDNVNSWKAKSSEELIRQTIGYKLRNLDEYRNDPEALKEKIDEEVENIMGDTMRKADLLTEIRNSIQQTEKSILDAAKQKRQKELDESDSKKAIFDKGIKDNLAEIYKTFQGSLNETELRSLYHFQKNDLDQILSTDPEARAAAAFFLKHRSKIYEEMNRPGFDDGRMHEFMKMTNSDIKGGQQQRQSQQRPGGGITPETWASKDDEIEG